MGDGERRLGASGTRPRESDRVEDELRWMIITLELAPGTPLSESTLTAKLGCGRTPLREALQRLESEYLVETLPRRGVSIAGLSVMDFAELAEAIPDIEVICVRLAAKRISDAEVAQLDEIVDAALAADERRDVPALALADYEFHRVLAVATRNHYLADTMTRMRSVAARFAALAWRRTVSARESWEEHRQVVDALRAHDAERAEALLREHYMRSSRRDAAAIGVTPSA